MSDAYIQLFIALEHESVHYIDKTFTEVTRELASLLPASLKAEGLFLVIDEANVGSRLFTGYFHDEVGPYPILKEIIKIWRERLTLLGVPVTFVIAGTVISKQCFPSSSPEWSTWKWTSDTGAFDNWEFAYGSGAEEDNALVRSTVHEVIFHYLLTGQHPQSFRVGRIDLVTSGVGQFTDGSMQTISVDTPAIFQVAAAMWLASSRSHSHGYGPLMVLYEEFTSYCRWENGDLYAPACYIATSLAHPFKDGRALTDLFILPTKPQWAEKTPDRPDRIVVLHKDDDGNLHETLISPLSLLPTSPPLGYAARSVEDVAAWLRHEHPTAFCICPPECGANLIFVLKRDEKYLWVVLRISGLGTDAVISTDDSQVEFDQLLPTMLFAGNARSKPPHILTDTQIPQIENTPEVPIQSVLDGFSAFPNRLQTGGQFSGMQRVVASFPTVPSLPRNYAQGMKLPPVATLDTTAFQTVSQTINVMDIVDGLVANLHRTRKRPSITDDSDGPLLKRLKSESQSRSSTPS
ncbi:hypothetical protein DXG03_007419 [Asterophora parasitica]|uniref:Uncharacterized protein n=1 Tax=Asterophora parasitica TaxID=117018 RepID=A0A9P7KAC5_9AGAR|nr:hypothetical protein DXG03_007419 [Asterophora parasitica]